MKERTIMFSKWKSENIFCKYKRYHKGEFLLFSFLAWSSYEQIKSWWIILIDFFFGFQRQEPNKA